MKKLFLLLAIALFLNFQIAIAVDSQNEQNKPQTANPTHSTSQLPKDVPQGHWAAESVKKMSELGIMKGYPDGTFKGDAPVTRYELAVTLDRFIQMIQVSRRPIADTDSKLNTDKTPKWAVPSIEKLTTGGYLPKNSPILTDGSKPVSAEELAEALAYVAAEIIRRDVPDSGAEPNTPR